MSGLSVIICAHNPRADYLRRVLEALRAQTLPVAQWELLLIDNASKEPLAGQWDLSWQPQGRCLREENLGLTPARLRGIKESRGETLVFVDDDNVLARDYLEQAQAIAGAWPKLGAWGGSCEPEFEEPPAPDVARKVGHLALRTVDREVWCNFAADYQAVPFGAGLCVRRAVAEAYWKLAQDNQARIALDRKGTSLASAGDLDLALTAHDVGLGTGLFPQLRLVHIIPARRVQKDYLIKLYESQAHSEYVLRRLRNAAAGGKSSWRSEITQWLKRCLMNPTERSFAEAYRRGRKRAEAELAKS